MKKYISWLLALMIACVSVSAFADNEANTEYIPKAPTGFAEPIHPVQLNAVGADVWENTKNIIIEGLKNHEAEIKIPETSEYRISAPTSDQLGDYVRSLYCEALDENTDIFYAFTEVGYSYYTGDTEGCRLAVIYPYYLDGAYELRDVFNLRVENILKQTIKSDMTDVQKAFALHDYLIANTTYGYIVTRAEAFPEKYAGTAKADEQIAVSQMSEHMADIMTKGELSAEEEVLKNKILLSHTAYGAVMNGVGVCQSYSLAYNILCKKAGIECINVYSNDIRHMWNMVKIGGSWYNVDVTYDDPIYSEDNIAENDLVQSVFGGNHANLLISDAAMKENHLDSNTGADGSDAYVYGKNALPVCSDKTYESNQVFTDIKNPMHYYGGYYYYTKSYSNADDEYFRISSSASAQPEAIPKQQYTAFVNMSATAPYAVSGEDTSIHMYAKEGAELTSVHVNNMDKVGFQLTSNDADKINMWIGYYNAAGALIGCKLNEVIPENGSAELDMQTAGEAFSGAVQARIFFWDGQNNTLRPLTDDFIKIA